MISTLFLWVEHFHITFSLLLKTTLSYRQNQWHFVYFTDENRLVSLFDSVHSLSFTTLTDFNVQEEVNTSHLKMFLLSFGDTSGTLCTDTKKTKTSIK